MHINEDMTEKEYENGKEIRKDDKRKTERQDCQAGLQHHNQ